MSSDTSSSSSIATFNGSVYELSVQRLLKYSFSSQSSSLLSDMLVEELRRWEVASTWFHQSRLPTLFGRPPEKPEKCDFIDEMWGKLEITFQPFIYLGTSDNAGI